MILFTNNNSEKLVRIFFIAINANIISTILLHTLHSPILTTHYKALNRGNDTSIF